MWKPGSRVHTVKNSDLTPLSAMPIELPLSTMSVQDKLSAMETLWDELCRDDSQIESPAWHEAILQDRAAKVQAGTEVFMDWEKAKRNLRERLQ